MQRLTFITNYICPFAERVWITLEEKKLQYDVKTVDLKNKEAYFTENYKKAIAHDPKSDGKVPVLIDGDITITESDLTAFYLAEKFQEQGSELLPKNPLLKFKMRYFASKYNKLITNFYGYIGFNKKSEEEKKVITDKTSQILQQLNDELVLPYAIGDTFTMADIMIYPWLARWVAISKNASLPNLSYQRVEQWVKNIQNRESVKKTKMNEQFYVEGYKPYFG